MNLQETCTKYYLEGGYNCAEALLHAANDFYDLHIHPEDLKLMAGFGAGIYSGLTCGALSATIAILSKKYIQTKAHDQIPLLSRADRLAVKNFREELGGINCGQIKPQFHDRQTRCLPTVLAASKALEKTIREIDGTLIQA